MANPIEGLQPTAVWKWFAQIARIPRGSKNEAAITKFILKTAKDLGLEAKADPVGNVVARKPASPGKENAPSVCLQGHLDMVCEKNVAKVHDFSKDPIELVRKDDYITANGTTLGADNGIAVATNLAIMSDKSLEHGPMEFLFTVDEETGLTGANNLQPGFLQSKTLINLDSEEEGFLFVGCSGGQDSTGLWSYDTEEAPAKHTAAQLSVRGLKGGHSGLEIDKGRGNAIKIMTRALVRLAPLGARISSLEAGNKRNAIPREADAVLFIPAKNVAEAKAKVERFAEVLRAEVATVDPDLSITLELKKMRAGKVVRKPLQKKLLQTLTALPHGVIKMSADIPGLVETSTNLAMIRTSRKAIQVDTSQRSSVSSEIDAIVDSVRAVFELGGAEVHGGSGYPGWKPNLSSEILRITKETYKELYGKEPEVAAIHAGLECGIIGEKYPGMDMVSFGPTLTGVHTPDERIYVDTVDRYWRLLLAVLGRI